MTAELPVDPDEDPDRSRGGRRVIRRWRREVRWRIGPDDPCGVARGDRGRLPVRASTRSTSHEQHSATGRWLSGGAPGIGAERSMALPHPRRGLVDPTNSRPTHSPRSRSHHRRSVRARRRTGAPYVQVPTWLWLDPTWWQTHEATANTGRVWSTVRATPVATTLGTRRRRSVSCRSGHRRPGFVGGRAVLHPPIAATVSDAWPGGTFNLRRRQCLEVRGRRTPPAAARSLRSRGRRRLRSRSVRSGSGRGEAGGGGRPRTASLFRYPSSNGQGLARC